MLEDRFGILGTHVRRPTRGKEAVMNYIIAKTINLLGLSGLFASPREQRSQQALNDLSRLEASSSGIPAQSSALLSRIVGMNDDGAIRELSSSHSGLTESEAAARLKRKADRMRKRLSSLLKPCVRVPGVTIA